MIKLNSQCLENTERVQYLQYAEFKMCIQYWENSKSILVSNTSKWGEWKRISDEETKELERIKSRNSFASRLIRSISPSRKEDSLEVSEMKDMKHRHYQTNSIGKILTWPTDEFLSRFRQLPVYDKLLSLYDSEKDELTQSYREFILYLKDLLHQNSSLTLEYNLKVLTDFLVSKYLKLRKLQKDKIGKADEQMNSKLEKLRLIGYSSKFNIPQLIRESEVTRQCVVRLEGLWEKETPREKLDEI